MHLIYDEIKQLFLNLCIRFCKPETVELINCDKFSEQETFHVSNLISLKDYKAILGSNILEELVRGKVQENEILIFTDKIRKHYIAACLHIAKKSTYI